MMDNKNHKAFTLAETLITLLVIGVIATLTIPSLLSSITKNQNLVALKKKYSEVQQAIKLSVIDNAEPSQWDYTLDEENFFAKYFAPYLATTPCNDCWLTYHYEPKGMFWESPAWAVPDCWIGMRLDSPELCYIQDKSECETMCTTQSWCEECKEACLYAFDNCLNGNDPSAECQSWKTAQQPDNTPDDTPGKTYHMANGSSIGVLLKEELVYIYIDINGSKTPNKYGNDQFLFTMAGDRLQPFGYGEANLTAGEYGCSPEGNGMYCAAMILKNNWTYPENYMK